MKTLLTVAFATLCLLSSALHAESISNISHVPQSTHWWCDPLLLYPLAGILILGIPSGILGTSLFFRQEAMFGDALSHMVFPGVILGALSAQYSLIIAFLVTFSGVGITYYLSTYTKLKQDMILGIMLSSYFALGVSLLSAMQYYGKLSSLGLTTWLLGSLSGVSSTELAYLGSFTLGTLLIVYTLRRNWLLYLIESSYIKLRVVIWTLITCYLILASKLVGLLVAIGIMIIAPACAYYSTRKLDRFLFLSMGYSWLMGIIGTTLSYFISRLAPGPSILVSGSVMLLLLIFSQKALDTNTTTAC